MPFYSGLYSLDDTVVIPFATTESDGTVVQPDSAPTWRAFGISGPLESSYGTASRYTVGGGITNVTTANPFVVTTSDPHGLQVGDVVYIEGVLGLTGVNGVRTVSAATSNTFSVASASSGTYTSGGEASFNGLWKIDLSVSEANGYSENANFSLVCSFAVSAAQYKQIITFGVG